MSTITTATKPPEIDQEIERKLAELRRYWATMSAELSWCGVKPPNFAKILELYPQAKALIESLAELYKKTGRPAPESFTNMAKLIEKYREYAEKRRCP